MGIIKKRLRVGGMSCINCQNKIERKLKSTAGIDKVVVNYNTGFADIIYDSDIITFNDIQRIIKKLGYYVLPEDGKPEADIERVVSILAIIVSLYVLFQHFGILNLLVPSQLADTKMGYGMLFVVGLFTSVHCIAMCGGIHLSQCIPQIKNEKKSNRKLDTFRPAFLYNLGRVISYTVIGFILGLAGMLLGGGSGIGLSTLFQGILKIIAGIFMVIMGINMLGIFPWMRRFHLQMPKFLAARIDRKKAASRQPLMIGLLNGLMPCAPLQSMQIVALASGNPFAGAFSMFLFSLGTVPLMMGFGSLVSALGKKFSQNIMSVGAVLVVVLGLAMLSQGGSLSGLLLPDRLFTFLMIFFMIGVIFSVPFNKNWYRIAGIVLVFVIMTGIGMVRNRLNMYAGAKESKDTTQKTKIVGGVQEIHSTLTSGRYPNINVKKGIPVKWVIDVPSGTINGCNYKMLLQEYGVEHEFKEGENTIEFTPEKTGTIQYTCWMGMIRGNIFVTEENETKTADSSEQPSEDVPIPAGFKIPSDELAIARFSKDEDGQDVQKVSIELTNKGFRPAVVVVEKDVPVIWNIKNKLSDDEKGIELLAPVYSTKLELKSGKNRLSVYPQDSFEVYTGDNKFYAYVKTVDDIHKINKTAIRQEVHKFETLIYPDRVFESSGMGCCGGN